VHTHQCFALLHIFLSEQELAVQVRQVYSVKIQKSNISEPSQYDIFHCKRHASVMRNRLENRIRIIQSSHPMPPAPTNNTFVSERRACNSAPSIALACAVRASAVDIVYSNMSSEEGYLKNN
jgi:hypothetical protein